MSGRRVPPLSHGRQGDSLALQNLHSRRVRARLAAPPTAWTLVLAGCVGTSPALRPRTGPIVLPAGGGEYLVFAERRSDRYDLQGILESSTELAPETGRPVCRAVDYERSLFAVAFELGLALMTRGSEDPPAWKPYDWNRDPYALAVADERVAGLSRDA